MSKFGQMTISNQWAVRPPDERFTSLTELAAFKQLEMQQSRGIVVPSRQIEAVSMKDENDHDTIRLKGPKGKPAVLTHWAFSQLAERAKAPANYLRTLHPTLAADNINYGIQVLRPVDDIGILIHKDENGGLPELRAITGPNYGRVWDYNVVKEIGNVLQTDGLNGEKYNIPGQFGERIAITKENTTLYASDRDMFCFLADETKTIAVKDRRDGKHTKLSRGVGFGNSDVGKDTLWYVLILYDYLCCNRIIWGMGEITEKRIRHTSAASERFLREWLPAIEAFANSSAAPQEAVIAAAQKQRVADVDKFLKNRQFSKNMVSNIKAAFKNDEQVALDEKATLWNVVVGLTAYARGVQYQDERVKLEREAGKILQLAA